MAGLCESIENIIAGEWSRRAAQLQSILKAFPSQWNTMETPLIVSGDFNSDSHLDWKDDTKNMNGHNGYVRMAHQQVDGKSSFY